MVLNFELSISKSQKVEITKFIYEQMSISGRVRKFAVDDDIRNICTVIGIGIGGAFFCKLYTHSEIKIGGGPEVLLVKKNCGKLEVGANGRAKWQSGPSYVDGDGKEWPYIDGKCARLEEVRAACKSEKKIR